jgi:hypothetical protein
LEVLKAYDTLAAAAEKPLHYSCNNEVDSNVTEFEMLSNARMIVIASHLPEIKQAALVSILHALYSNNYWVFNAEDPDGDCIIYQDEKLNENMIEKLANYNLKAWCDYLFTGKTTPLPVDCSYDLTKPAVELEYYSHDIYVDEYKKRNNGVLPDNGIVKRPTQKIYTIDKLITMAKSARRGVPS